jgi:lipopolysaccharide/colanic/teichoic acid biosynthesis glycosyltransferase
MVIQALVAQDNQAKHNQQLTIKRIFDGLVEIMMSAILLLLLLVVLTKLILQQIMLKHQAVYLELIVK